MRRVVGVVSFLLTHFFAYSQDLVITDVSGPKSFQSYGSLSVDATLKNNGILDISRYIFTTAYLSSDNVLNTSTDKNLGVFAHSPLSAYASATANLTANLDGVLPGTYYLILYIDKANQITETDETNNITVVDGYTITTSSIDFSITSLTLSSPSIGLYDYALPTFEITNSGTIYSSSIYTSFYLSTDNVLDASDVFMYAAYSNVAGANVKSFSSEVRIPAVAPGAYYLIAKADDKYSNIPEANESNNTAYLPLNITASNFDLDITSAPRPIAEFQFSARREFYFYNFSIRNNGTTGVVGYSLEFYLSTNAVLDASDWGTLDWQVNNGYYVGAGKTFADINRYTIPEGVPAGTYYVICRLNKSSALPESNLANNLVVTQNQITIPPVNSSVMSGASFADSYDNTDQQLQLRATLTNGSTPSSFAQIFEIKIRDASGAVKFSRGEYEIVTLYSSYETETLEWDFNLPAPLAVGTYTVDITCSGSPCYTQNYSLPLVIKQVPHGFSGSIRGEDNLPISKGKLFLYQKNSSGKIGFIQKISPTVSDQFAFQIDHNYHTLYFVPDAVQFPDYLPTVFGKSFTLKGNSFFRSTNDTTVVFEILKTQPIASGTQTISGYSTGDTGGTMALTTTVVPCNIILLAEDGTPLKRVQTNASGYYEFANIPAAKYQVIAIPDVDRIPMDNPTQVDVSITSATVDFVFTPKGAIPSVTPILFNQQITFDVVQSKTFGDAPFDITAHASSDLQVSYVSSNPEVAIITGNVITIKGAGETVITARQQGNAIYNPAVPITQTLRVDKAVQVISMDPIQAKTFGDQPFEITANTNAPLDLIYSSSDPTVATIENNIVTIVGAGETTITSTQPGNTNYQEALPVAQVLSINKADQNISFDPLETKRILGTPFQLNAIASSGLPIAFESSNTEVATVSGSVVTIIGVGNATITAAQVGSNNYHSAENVSHTLQIDKALQRITFEALPAKKFNDEIFDLSATSDSDLTVTFTSSNPSVAEIFEGKVVIKGVGSTVIKALQSGNEIYEPAISIEHELFVVKANQQITFAELEAKTSNSDDFFIEAHTTSLLPVSFTSDNPEVATIEGNKVFIHGAGIAKITAHQNGDEHFEPAETVARTLEVSLVTGIESVGRVAKLYPNPTSGILFFETPESVTHITVVDMLGRPQSIVLNGDNIDVSQLKSGVYYIKIVSGNSFETVRIVKE